MNHNKVIVFIFCILFFSGVQAQPHWKELLIVSPAYFGPNALPVPEENKGYLEENSSVRFTLSGHYLPGDPTQDISTRCYFAFLKGRIGLELQTVLIEHYNFSKEIMNERNTITAERSGFSFGDVNFTTHLQLVKNKKSYPDITMRISSRSTSGHDLMDARYTDMPGYYTDIGFSKEFGDIKKMSFRPFFSGGFYCWQTNDFVNYQNDAFMYALGFELKRKKSYFTTLINGYKGYKGNGDAPMIAHVEWRRDFEKSALKLRYQYGITDYKYQSFLISYVWKLGVIQFKED